MKSVAQIILLLLLSSAVFSQSAVIPIVKDNVLLGGVQDGKWLTAEQIFPKMKDKSAFILIGLKENENRSLTTGTKSQYSTCSDLPDIEIEKKSKSVIALGSEAKWNPVPRFPKGIAFTDKTNQKIVGDFLKSKRINAAKIKIGQSLQVDLDGDGTQETVIATDYYETEDLETRAAGDYSFIVLTKIINGRPTNILVDGDFFTQKGASGSPDTRSILLIADLNGDGTMEIILRVDHQEGHWNRVYQLNENKLTKVLEVYCQN